MACLGPLYCAFWRVAIDAGSLAVAVVECGGRAMVFFGRESIEKRESGEKRGRRRRRLSSLLIIDITTPTYSRVGYYRCTGSRNSPTAGFAGYSQKGCR